MRKSATFLLTLFCLGLVFNDANGQFAEPTFIDTLKLEKFTLLQVQSRRPHQRSFRIIKDFYFNNEKIVTAEYFNDTCTLITKSKKLVSIPESYDMGVSLIKDASKKIIGMTKQYNNMHLIGLNNIVFRLKKAINEGRDRVYTLIELENGKDDIQKFLKVIVIKGDGRNIKIYHNLDEIPVAIIPVLLNVK